VTTTTVPTTIATAIEPSTRTVKVAGLELKLRESGSGPPLLLLHRSTGVIIWDTFEDQLAANFTVIHPDLPGFGESDRPDWAREPRDLAIIVGRLLEALDIEDVTLVGLGFGGFVAAELATMNETRLKSFVLVSPAGIKPREGEIVDQMLIAHDDYVRLGLNDPSSFETRFGAELHPDVKDIWEFNRIMAARITWSPYMFSRRLPHLLGTVNIPSLIVWGDNDQIIPAIVGDQYAECLTNATQEIVASAGHIVEWDQPEQLAALISNHAR
jgi:pimeloyl-ACP methyl ester carboxylesterase